MAKKTWVKIKVGLFRDPKHRASMGSAVWLFGHMIDIADWETGTIPDYRDQNAADSTALHINTVRKYRKILEDQEYITVTQHGPKGQRVVIHKWVNPRTYDGKVLNNPDSESDTNVLPSEEEGDESGENKGNTPPDDNTEGNTEKDTYSPSDSVPPTLDSDIKPPVPETATTAANIFQLCESILGLMPTHFMRDQLIDMEETYSLEWVTEAMQEAAKNSVMKLNYVEAILKRWKLDGKPIATDTEQTADSRAPLKLAPPSPYTDVTPIDPAKRDALIAAAKARKKQTKEATDE